MFFLNKKNHLFQCKHDINKKKWIKYTCYSKNVILIIV